MLTVDLLNILYNDCLNAHGDVTRLHTIVNDMCIDINFTKDIIKEDKKVLPILREYSAQLIKLEQEANTLKEMLVSVSFHLTARCKFFNSVCYSTL